MTAPFEGWELYGMRFREATVQYRFLPLETRSPTAP